VPEPRLGGTGRFASSGPPTSASGKIGLAAGAHSSAARHILVLSTVVDVLWTSPDQEERAE